MSFKEDIVSYIQSGESDDKNLGLEIEHFVVDENGDQIGFDEITDLIETVSDKLNAKTSYSDGYPVGYTTDEYAITLEPSISGSFNSTVSPCFFLSLDLT